MPRQSTEGEPRVCPKCKSPYWNKPRKINEKRYKIALITSLAEGVGFEPTTLLGLNLLRDSAFGVLVLQTSGINHSPTLPLKSASGESASQTFAPHLHYLLFIAPFFSSSRIPLTSSANVCNASASGSAGTFIFFPA